MSPQGVNDFFIWPADPPLEVEPSDSFQESQMFGKAAKEKPTDKRSDQGRNAVREAPDREV